MAEACTRGVLRVVAPILLIGLIVAYVWGNVFAGTDDTDYGRFSRSGLTIHTDAKTGVQYLSDGHGGMQVRVGTNGLPMVKGAR